MNHAGGRSVSRRAAIRTAALALAAVPLMRGTSRGSFLPGAAMIEEDWTLIVSNPDKVNHAPGIKMIMSTQGDLLGYSADYSINYHKEGDPATFSPGGYGIELCSPCQDQPTTVSSTDLDLMDTPGETLSWTQRLKLSGGTLSFSLRNTSSTTWDTTSGEALSVSAPCTLSDLSNYDPSFSAFQSGPIWWASRVQSLVMTAVRYYDATGRLLQTDPTDRSAYP
jgi:hypothetical protein